MERLDIRIAQSEPRDAGILQQSRHPEQATMTFELDVEMCMKAGQFLVKCCVLHHTTRRQV